GVVARPCAAAAAHPPASNWTLTDALLFAVNQNTDKRSFSRRHFLRATGTIGLLALTKADAAETSGFLSAFFSFDREIRKFMAARNVPGGALAVVKDRRLVYARGYG